MPKNQNFWNCPGSIQRHSGVLPELLGGRFEAQKSLLSVSPKHQFFSNRAVSWHLWGSPGFTGPPLSGRLGGFYFFYMARSTLPPFWHFSKTRVGQIRRPGPMCKKASEGPMFRHIFADIFGSSPPPPHVSTQEIQIGSKLSSEQRRVSGEIRNTLFQ